MLPHRFFISVCQSLIYFPPQRGQMSEDTDRAVETIGGREGRHAQANCMPFQWSDARKCVTLPYC